MIVDDERLVIDGLSLTFKREFSGEFEVCASATNGREALRIFAAASPDIVLMDVSMPGLNGLEVIREMVARGSTAAFILVTAYERFDIVREALSLGAVDYLLKPVSREVLLKALRAASRVIEERLERQQIQIEHEEWRDRLRALAELAFFQGLMLGPMDAEAATICLESLGRGAQDGIVAAAAFLPPPGAPNLRAEEQRLHSAYRSALRYRTTAIVGPLVEGRCAALIPLKKPEDADAAREAFEDAIRTVLGTELEDGTVRIGFGMSAGLGDARASWLAALQALGGTTAGSSRRAHEGSALALAASSSFDADESFLAAFAAGSRTEAGIALERLLAELGNVSPGEARARLLALFGSILRQRARAESLRAQAAPNFAALDGLASCASPTLIERRARELFVQLASGLEEEPRWSAPVAKAIAYIRDNFPKPISLESAADRIGMSAARLSRLVVEETGHGFSDLLIERRIRHAKSLLATPGITVKEASILSGYSDPNYFSRLFKKVTGSSPSAWTPDTLREEEADTSWGDAARPPQENPAPS
jgi:two-component system response regulator YesN